ncbi:putative assembly factor cbp4 [Blumeria hordei DH14]|uniref:Cytochrome b mRNA-processing protein 4 n=1 Tax=Blumeria graminis f. sp. hordei (strain DH14) TaxID=546991 RepID=N1JBT8_BLUG1|nr:putative assembly factor cbp4 [Blumeria hordei DH14]
MPPKKPINWKMLGKMTAAGLICCIGGPALVMYVSPTPEELFSRYNPDLQKRALESREKRQQEFDDFVMKLREYSKSDRPIWLVAEDAAKKDRESKLEGMKKLREEKMREAEEQEAERRRRLEIIKSNS